jgi:hypothetical protein
MIPRYVGQAAVDGDVELVKGWLTSGARDVNEDVEGASLIGDGGVKLLHLSLHRPERLKSLQLVKLLLEHGADATAIYVSSDMTATPLHLCLHPDEAALLLDHGADIEAQDDVGARPLHMAVSTFALLHLLVRRGANIFAENEDGRDAEAVARHFVEVAATGDTELRAQLAQFRPVLLKSADFLAAVKLDGGWQKYLRAPRIELVRLRSLCDRGRAAPCSTVTFENLEACHALTTAEMSIFERLFGASAKQSPRGSSGRIPNEIFWNILTFWRSSRDERPPTLCPPLEIPLVADQL